MKLSTWVSAKLPVKAHHYERGGHGFAKGTTGEKWLDQFMSLLNMCGMFKPLK